MSKLTFDTHETHLADGRRVAMWTLAPTGRPAHSLPIVVGAGFARRMHHFSGIAMYAAHNGFFVSRYDPVNHVGLSDGEMWNFNLTDSLTSLRAAVDETCRITGQDRVVIVATSLTARVAFQLAAQSDRVALVVTAVGVVNVRETLRRVFERDVAAVPLDKLSGGSVTFEGKPIGLESFCLDAHRNDWWTLESCVKALRLAKQSLVGFVGTEDEWVDVSDVQHAFSEGANGPRKLLTLERAPHELSRNASVAHTFVQKMLEEIIEFGGINQTPQDPPFEEIMEQSLVERRLQRGTGEAARATTQATQAEQAPG
ncbi:MAG: hypothetical protein MUF34_02910 [Polyangiaceae bacterium]|jgi:acyl transferase|nr:hypothetical protein [Polyangiaceae bacterium]